MNKRGEWKITSKDDDVFYPSFYCSECGRDAPINSFGFQVLSRKCLFCGAKMLFDESLDDGEV